jgi:hypothetical protein
MVILLSVALFERGQVEKIKAKAPTKKTPVALQTDTVAGNEADILADLDKEIEGSDSVQLAQTQMTQQGGSKFFYKGPAGSLTKIQVKNHLSSGL